MNNYGGHCSWNGYANNVPNNAPGSSPENPICIGDSSDDERNNIKNNNINMSINCFGTQKLDMKREKLMKAYIKRNSHIRKARNIRKATNPRPIHILLLELTDPNKHLIRLAKTIDEKVYICNARKERFDMKPIYDITSNDNLEKLLNEINYHMQTELNYQNFVSDQHLVYPATYISKNTNNEISEIINLMNNCASNYNCEFHKY